jgi:hypothetical protein
MSVKHIKESLLNCQSFENCYIIILLVIPKIISMSTWKIFEKNIQESNNLRKNNQNK